MFEANRSAKIRKTRSGLSSDSACYTLGTDTVTELQRHVPLAEEARRLIAEPIQAAAHALRGADLVEAVHDARKALKRSRAALAAFAGAFGPAQLALRIAVRDAGRRLGTVRDRHARLEALAAFVARRSALAAALEPVRVALQDAIPLDDAADRAEAHAVAADLEALAAGASTWAAAHDAGDALQHGLRRSYRRARRAMRAAYEEPTTDRFHAWRRRCKDVQYQWMMLRPIWPEVFDGYIEAAKALGDDLGEEHDAALLAFQLLNDATLRGLVTARADCLAALESVRAELRARARHLGRRLFAERPRLYVQRLLTWRRAWQDEARTGLAP